MATIQTPKSESSFTSDALDLLGCFAYGIDDVICRIAEHEAMQRTGMQSGVEIGTEDIERAVSIFIESLKNSELPADLKPEINRMLVCLSEKLEQPK